MKILAHRGVWEEPNQQNTLQGFHRALEMGFGIELDVRDLNGNLVVAHDPPTQASLPFSLFMELSHLIQPSTPIALNVKSCGLSTLLGEALSRSPMEAFFVFDAAVPDMLPYVQSHIPIFTRVSEIETPVLEKDTQGYWMDELQCPWITEEEIATYLGKGKTLAVVSPELHQRPHKRLWEMLGEFNKSHGSQIQLCTDYPTDANEYFNGN